MIHELTDGVALIDSDNATFPENDLRSAAII
jgi:hypothetical protein